MPKRKDPLTKTEFDAWAGDMKESFNSLESKLDEHTRRLTAIEEKLEPLERIATSLQRIEENTAAMLSLYQRVDWRTLELGRQVGVDVALIDARYPGPPGAGDPPPDRREPVKPYRPDRRP